MGGGVANCIAAYVGAVFPEANVVVGAAFPLVLEAAVLPAWDAWEAIMVTMTPTTISATTPMTIYWFLFWMARRRRISLFMAVLFSDIAFISLSRTFDRAYSNPSWFKKICLSSSKTNSLIG
jgi:hypothetical protein